MNIVEALKKLDKKEFKKFLKENYDELLSIDNEIRKLEAEVANVKRSITNLDSYKLKTYYPEFAKKIEELENKYYEARQEYTDYLKAEGRYYKERIYDDDRYYDEDTWLDPDKNSKPNEYAKAMELRNKSHEIWDLIREAEKDLIDKVKESDEFNSNKQLKADLDQKLKNKEQERKNKSDELKKDYKEVIDIIIKNVSRNPSFKLDEVEPSRSGVDICFKKDLDTRAIVNGIDLDEDEKDIEVDPDDTYCENIAEDLWQVAEIPDLEDAFPQFKFDVYCSYVDSDIYAYYDSEGYVEAEGDAIGYFVISIEK